MSGTSRNIEYSTPAIEAFYREHRTRWEHFYPSERVVFERLAPSAASRVLDIGCGCGGLGLALRERFGVVSYTGVEINKQAAEAGRSVYPEGQFLHADILAITPQELQESSFDLVVSLSCIDWNVQFADMLAAAFRFVKPGGCFVASFRLTPGEALLDVRQSYQYINFEGRREGEVAPYVVLNTDVLLSHLKKLAPARIEGYGYWGSPSATAVTPLSRIGFAVLAIQKAAAGAAGTEVHIELPADMWSTPRRVDFAAERPQAS